MILMIDNYDSFTYNLVDYLEQLGEEVIVKRNDQVSIADIEDLVPELIVISPGPGVPKEAGVSMEIINNFKGEIPILGICLGHQVIAEVFDAEIVETIDHYNQGVFNGLSNPLKITRYHSLVVAKENLPLDLEITAVTKEGEIMGLKHKKYLIEGVQFHPEALLTEQGQELLANFIAEARGEKGDRKNSN